MPSPEGGVQLVFTCECCGLEFERRSARGRKPRTCRECLKPSARIPRKRTRKIRPVPGEEHIERPPVEHLAAVVSNYRIAIEIARHGLRCGHGREVIEVLDGVVQGIPLLDCLENLEELVAAAERQAQASVA